MAEATQPLDQAPVQSMEDRIAAQFGLVDDPVGEVAEEEASEEVSEETTEPEAEFAEVEYDGATYQVPKALEKAILQEKDYTQKTQTLAEQRRQVEYQQKALEAAKLEREFNEQIAPDLMQLSNFDNYLSQLKQRDLSQLPVDELIKFKFNLDNLKERRDALAKSIEDRKSEYSAKAKQAVQALRAQAKDLISKRIKDYSDATLSDLGEYAKAQGYTEQDIEMIQLDPRASEMLWKAKMYDALQANKAEAVQKAKTAPPAVKPGASKPMPDAVKQKLALRKAFKSASNKADRDALMQKRVEALFG